MSVEGEKRLRFRMTSCRSNPPAICSFGLHSIPKESKTQGGEGCGVSFLGEGTCHEVAVNLHFDFFVLTLNLLQRLAEDVKRNFNWKNGHIL